jgi:hypothetical protein
MLLAALTLMLTNCDDMLTTKSATAVSSDEILSSTTGLNMLQRASYNYLLYGDKHAGGQETGCYTGIPGFNLYYDISGQDILSTGFYGMSPTYCYVFDPRRTIANGFANKIWRQSYIVINQANILIDALPEAAGDATEKRILEGQAKAMRGICYFHLLMNYQQTYAIAKDKRGVILRTKADDPTDKGFSTVGECYDQVVADLREAKTLLSGFTRDEKWQINADVAAGYLARVYQVMGNWSGALEEATWVYNRNLPLMTREEWCGGFDDIDVAEVIWAVVNTNLSNNWENTVFNYWDNFDPSYGENQSDGPIYNYLELFVGDEYVNLFDETDYRGTKCTKTENVTDEDELPVMFWHRTSAPNPEWKTKWAYNKFKYYGDAGGAKASHSYPDYSILRTSEMLLIKAEAEANIAGKTTDALASLNTLQRVRNAGLTTTTEKTALLEEIYKERRKELLCEGVTGMYDFVRLQRDLVRYEATAANPGGHFSWGMTNLDGYNGADAQPRATLPSNDYRWFCQIPSAEFSNNTAISPSDQNPFTGR